MRPFSMVIFCCVTGVAMGVPMGAIVGALQRTASAQTISSPMILAQATLPAPEKRNPALPRPLHGTGPQPSPGWMKPSPGLGKSQLRDDRKPGFGQPTIGRPGPSPVSGFGSPLQQEAKRYGQRFKNRDLNFRRKRCGDRASRYGLFELEHQKFVTACMFPW